MCRNIENLRATPQRTSSSKAKNIIFIRMQLASSAGISPIESGGGKKFGEHFGLP
jgi:hypothetical protein